MEHNSHSASPRRKRSEGCHRERDSRSRSMSPMYGKMEGRPDGNRYMKGYSSSRSRSRDRKAYRNNKYADGHRRGSHSRSRSPYRRSRSKSRSYSRSRYSRDNKRSSYREKSRSPMSNRKRHVGDRENPTPSRCLGVFGLSSNTTESQIYEIFSKYGQVERVVVVIDAKTKCAKGFCFVYFCRLEDSMEAKSKCTGMSINNRLIRVAYSITERAHTPTPGIYMGKPTHLRRGSRRPYNGYRDNHYNRRSRTPYYRRRGGRYNRSRSRSCSPRRY